MNLLEKLEAEQAVGWPSPPPGPLRHALTVELQRDLLEELCTVLVEALEEADGLSHRDAKGRWTSSTSYPQADGDSSSCRPLVVHRHRRGRSWP